MWHLISTRNKQKISGQSNTCIFFLADSPYCSGRSFELYMSRLHPENNKLWQRPRASFFSTDDIWYCNEPVGEKKLTVFMSELSKSAPLSQIYTNHSIRATGPTILSKNKYGPVQIMAVTGHKSVQSLTVYYKRVDNEEKIRMGQTLSENLVKKSNQTAALPSTAVLALPAPDAEKTSCNQLALHYLALKAMQMFFSLNLHV